MGDDEDLDIEEELTKRPEVRLLDEKIIGDDLSHICAMKVQQRAKAMTLEGQIGSSTVTILVDMGSTHDFLHMRVAERLHLPLTEIKPFRVYVGNGESILCSHVSKATRLMLQGKQFLIDLHILSVHGLDVVLGMEWLESLGKVTHDYVHKSMEFIKDDHRVILRGIDHPPKKVSANSLAALMTHMSGLEFYELMAVDRSCEQLPLTEEVVFPDDVRPEITAVAG